VKLITKKLSILKINLITMGEKDSECDCQECSCGKKPDEELTAEDVEPFEGTGFSRKYDPDE
jgi:hypothetical protein